MSVDERKAALTDAIAIAWTIVDRADRLERFVA
jgi:hypothetical protein